MYPATLWSFSVLIAMCISVCSLEFAMHSPGIHKQRCSFQIPKFVLPPPPPLVPNGSGQPLQSGVPWMWGALRVPSGSWPPTHALSVIFAVDFCRSSLSCFFFIILMKSFYYFLLLLVVLVSFQRNHCLTSSHRDLLLFSESWFLSFFFFWFVLLCFVLQQGLTM